MSTLKVYPILLSETEATKEGAEGVYAIIRNDYVKDETGKPIFGKEYGYQMTAAQPHGPIPQEPRTGFATAKDAEVAAKREYQEWRAGNIPAGTKMERHHTWRTEYRIIRYLDYMNEDELCERYGDIQNNLLTLTEDRKIGFIPMNEMGDYWGSVHTHILEECVLRKYQYPYPFDRCVQNWQMPDYDWPGIEQAAAAYKARTFVPSKFLIKYGEFKYLKPAYEKGAIRISPASRYSDPSLNRAIRDEELELSIYYHSSRAKNEILDEYADELNPPVPPTGNVAYTLTAPTNYYVYCLAAEYNYRLFGDFEADCCLIINNPQIFIERLTRAVGEKLPNWRSFGTGVRYIDPLNTTKEELDIFFCKHFKYAYQKEYRMIWVPPTSEMALTHIDVELGSLKDCCELVPLKS
ncbi:MAG TPA: hypothetical protein VGN95_11025 [Pyrinomonadaceae bacterium]|jgi:hypothetical protein|nr:hypothetical protein [Pyrinomonadaceae bacterium]